MSVSFFLRSNSDRIVMTKEGGRRRGVPLNVPFMPSARAGALQKKGVNKSGRGLCIVSIQLETIRNH